jgi:UDP-N-acetylmuramate dehydrogenase
MRHPVPDALRARFGDRIRTDELLASHTSFRIGGPADLFVSAKSRADVADAVDNARAAGLPWLVLGRGSNVLIDDRGVRGLVVRNDSAGFLVDQSSGLVQSDSGVRLPTLGVNTAKAGLAGLEFSVGIPGSVGGGVVMNAGAHGGCVADVLLNAEILVEDRREVWPRDRFEHSYRTSRLQRERGVVVLGAEFQLAACPPAEALARIAAHRKHRQDTQPTDPGAGSIFRNPPDNSSGALVDRAGLKGTRRGDALISPKHGNFIVNVGDASSSDVIGLIELARETVLRQFGVLLQPEVEYIGPEGRIKLFEKPLAPVG